MLAARAKAALIQRKFSASAPSASSSNAKSSSGLVRPP